MKTDYSPQFFAGIAYAIYIIGFISGIILGDSLGFFDFNYVIMILTWIGAFFFGTIFIFFSSVLENQELNNRRLFALKEVLIKEHKEDKSHHNQ
jgi:hypothetical protein